MRADQITMNGTLLQSQGASIASAATINLALATGNSLTITGSTGPVTSLGTVAAGAEFTLTFASTPTLTHSSDLQLPNDADLTVAAGQVLTFVSLGAGAWKLVGFQVNYIPENQALKQNTPDPAWPSSPSAYPTVVALIGYSGMEITRADLITMRDGPGMAINQEFILTDSTPTRLMVRCTQTATSLSLTAIRYADPGAGAGVFGNYDLDTDTFTPLPGPAYTTISLASWTTLVGANGLVPGTFYLVTSAYPSTLFGVTWDILVLADSVNTAQEGAWVKTGGQYSSIFASCQTTADGSFTSVVLNETDPVSLGLTAAMVLAYAGEVAAGANVFIASVAMGGIYYETITSADGASIVLVNVKSLTDGSMGTYDPNTDIFTPNVVFQQVRMEITDAEIAAGTALNIVELPEVVDHFWNITEANISYTGTTPYTNIMYVGIIAMDPQFDDAGRLVVGTDSFGGMRDLRSDTAGGNGNCFAAGRCQVTFDSAGGAGDGTAVLYLAAQLVSII